MEYESIRVSIGKYNPDTKEFTETNSRVNCYASGILKSSKGLIMQGVEMLAEQVYDGYLEIRSI